MMKIDMSSHQQALFWCCLMTVFIAAVAALTGFASPLTTYQSGSSWTVVKMLTTHFTHTSFSHLAGNLAALFMMTFLFRINIRQLVAAYLLCITGLAWYVEANHIEVYLGFSALLYCHPGCYLAGLLHRKRWLDALLIITILAVYLGLIAPLNINPDAHWVSMTAAHLIGFFSGTLVAFIHLMYHGKHEIQLPTHPQSAFVDTHFVVKQHR